MSLVTADAFYGIWRSFKVFRNSGVIRYCSTRRYTEFYFGTSGTLKIKEYEDSKITEVNKSDNWQVDLYDKQVVLAIRGEKLSYEVLSIDSSMMVLMEVSSSEKIFFAKEETWAGLLQPNSPSIY
jgi:hypothetical protein